MTFLKLILVELNKRRNALLGWALGLFGFALMIMSVAPALADQFATLNLSDIAIYRAFGITETIDSAASLLGVYLPFFGLMTATFAVITGSYALAGEEDDGTLEMLLALPLRRAAVVLAKALAIVIVLVLLALSMFAGLALMFPSVSETLTTTVTLAALYNVSLDTIPLSFAFGMLALFLGAYLPRRTHALGLSLALLIGSYLFNNLGGTVDALEPALPYQPFYYYPAGSALTEGPNYTNTFILLGIGVVLLVLAVSAFQRRDVTVGNWPWQRPRESAA